MSFWSYSMILLQNCQKKIISQHKKLSTIGNFSLPTVLAVKMHHSVKWHTMATPHRSAAGWGFSYNSVSDSGRNCTYDIALVTRINICWWLCQSQRPLQRKGCQNGDRCSGAKPRHRLQRCSVHETRSNSATDSDLSLPFLACLLLSL